jgi:hypothetical protein
MDRGFKYEPLWQPNDASLKLNTTAQRLIGTGHASSTVDVLFERERILIAKSIHARTLAIWPAIAALLSGCPEA